MKYLRKFNESQKDFEEMCKNYLSYLSDDGFSLKFSKITDILFITKLNVVKCNEPFQWDDIKDTIIPFITVLNSEYNISITFFQLSIDYAKKYPYKDYEKVDYNIKEILNDNIKVAAIKEIMIRVKKNRILISILYSFFSKCKYLLF